MCVGMDNIFVSVYDKNMFVSVCDICVDVNDVCRCG